MKIVPSSLLLEIHLEKNILNFLPTLSFTPCLSYIFLFLFFLHINTFSVNDKTPLSAPIPDPIETKKGSGIPKLPAFGVTVVDAFEVQISVKKNSLLLLRSLQFLSLFKSISF